MSLGRGSVVYYLRIAGTDERGPASLLPLKISRLSSPEATLSGTTITDVGGGVQPCRASWPSFTPKAVWSATDHALQPEGRVGGLTVISTCSFASKTDEQAGSQTRAQALGFMLERSWFRRPRGCCYYRLPRKLSWGYG